MSEERSQKRHRSDEDSGGGGSAQPAAAAAVVPHTGGRFHGAASVQSLLLVRTRLNVAMDISAPVPRPKTDKCAHATADHSDLEVKTEERPSLHTSALFIEMERLPVQIFFRDSVIDALYTNLVNHEQKDASLRDTVPVFHQHMRDYHPAGTSIDTYHRTVLGGERCELYPDVSYIFGTLRNPVAPLLSGSHLPPDCPPHIRAMAWREDVDCVAVRGADVGPSIRNYFYVVLMQCWLAANNQFVHQNTYRADEPRHLMSLSMLDCREVGDSLRAATGTASDAATAAIPTVGGSNETVGMSEPDRQYYEKLLPHERVLYHVAQQHSGRNLALLATKYSLHEFIVIVQCKLRGIFVTAGERKHIKSNIQVILRGIRFRLCEPINLWDQYNEAIHRKYSEDMQDKDARKERRAKHRDDPTRKAPEKLGIASKTSVQNKEVYPNPSSSAWYTKHPKQEQSRSSPVPFTMSHAKFDPIRPILMWGNNPETYVADALWAMALYLNADDSTKLDNAIMDPKRAVRVARPSHGVRGVKYFCKANEPESVKEHGPHMLYLVLPPEGNIDHHLAVHPSVAWGISAKQSTAHTTTTVVVQAATVAAAATNTTRPAKPPQQTGDGHGKGKPKAKTKPKPKPKSADAAAAIATPQTSAAVATGGKRKRAGALPAATAATSTVGESTNVLDPAKLRDQMLSTDEPLLCSRGIPVFSPLNMSFDLLERFRTGTAGVAAYDYDDPAVADFLSKMRRAWPWPWSQNTPFLQQFLALADKSRTESSAWEALLHATAAINTPQDTKIDWKTRSSWVPQAIDSLVQRHVNDLEQWKHRKVMALMYARYTESTDAQVIAELGSQFGLLAGLDTYSAEAMGPLNRQFDEHFFTPHRVIGLLSDFQFRLEQHGQTLPHDTLNGLVQGICKSAATNTSIAECLEFHLRLRVEDKMDPLIARCWGEPTNRDKLPRGWEVVKKIVSTWIDHVKTPLFFHAAYITNPPVGPRLPGGSEWIRPNCEASDAEQQPSGSDRSKALPSDFKSLLNSAITRATAFAGKPQFSKAFSVIDMESLNTAGSIAGALLLAEGITRVLNGRYQNGKMLDVENKQRLLNNQKWLKKEIPGFIKQLARLYDVPITIHTPGSAAAAGAGSGAVAAAASASAVAPTDATSHITWPLRLATILKHKTFFTPHALCDVVQLAAGQDPDRSFDQIKVAVAKKMAALINEMQAMSVIDAFVNKHLVATGFHAPAPAAASSSAKPSYTLRHIGVYGDDQLELCLDVMVRCFNASGIKHDFAPFTPAMPPAQTSLHASVAAAAAAAASSSSVGTLPSTHGHYPLPYEFPEFQPDGTDCVVGFLAPDAVETATQHTSLNPPTH